MEGKSSFANEQKFFYSWIELDMPKRCNSAAEIK